MVAGYIQIQPIPCHLKSIFSRARKRKSGMVMGTCTVAFSITVISMLNFANRDKAQEVD